MNKELHWSPDACLRRAIAQSILLDVDDDAEGGGTTMDGVDDNGKDEYQDWTVMETDI